MANDPDPGSGRFRKDLRPPVIPETGNFRKIDTPAPESPAGPVPSLAAEAWRAPRLPSAEVLLDRSLRELVRFYRHSGCGRLCQGLAHRMSTPLQILFFQLELLEQKSLEEQQVLPEVPFPAGKRLQVLQQYRERKLQQFQQELTKLQGLVRAIVRQGAHEDGEDRIQIDLTELYRRELDLYLCHAFLKHQVEKEFHFQEGMPPLFGYYIDFSQSFRNLLDNALEALAGVARPRLVVATTLENGRRLLRLGDNGRGIPPEIKSRIFEPFFTTKGDLHHDRAGLGLFMARRLLAPYGGEITADSRPGETWMTVALPV
jgi:signal transduction histidine kinase